MEKTNDIMTLKDVILSHTCRGEDIESIETISREEKNINIS